MNYPIWDVPAPGLLIAAVAIVHVFIAHFAVGGGLFLVLTERKARRAHDPDLLAWLQRHSAFFILLTLVGGAMTGVGIWFTIGLIQPAATSSLIAAFVWGWAIEWTFFVVEIAAALVYYYGWPRMKPSVHMAVGWIYFWAAWLSLVVINGILSFMLTPGSWLTTHGFWDGVFNPTFAPTVVVRTAAAVGLAGLYAVLTAAWLADGRLKARIAAYAAMRWILPAAIVVPLGLAWLLAAASGAGVPIAEILGAKTVSIGATIQAVLAGSPSGHPMAQRALLATAGASSLVVLLTLGLFARRTPYGRIYAAALMACGFVALGGAEWLREDLRKPFVIDRYMYVTGVRATPPADAPAVPREVAAAFGTDRFTADALDRSGMLVAAPWMRELPAGSGIDAEIALGSEVFRLSCSSCHTVDGYMAIRPLVRGVSVAAAEGTIARLARWRNRRMPPFAGTGLERHALAIYLASLGGASPADLGQPRESAALGARLFEENCSLCHGPGGDTPLTPKGRSAAALYDLIGRLPSVSDAMPPFAGSDDERHALAEYVATLDAKPNWGGVR